MNKTSYIELQWVTHDPPPESKTRRQRKRIYRERGRKRMKHERLTFTLETNSFLVSWLSFSFISYSTSSLFTCSVVEFSLNSLIEFLFLFHSSWLFDYDSLRESWARISRLRGVGLSPRLPEKRQTSEVSSRGWGALQVEASKDVFKSLTALLPVFLFRMNMYQTFWPF